MLTVAAPSSGTEAERAAHRLFTLWDSGTRVLGGVAAFRPYDDPATKRRQSDVVLLVPDGVLVVRLVGSQRQRGPILAHPTGAWSIGGEVLRIAGGGSNPLPGLRDAQATVATTLRASGLEPGRVAMLVAVGSGESVDPQDGQLADGVIVCPLSEDGLAIGVRRAAALTAAADVRQWTTADVKAALSSIQASGRVPAVEELNAEGFMYSPYVLRRPDLVAAASAVAASAAESEASRPPSEAEAGSSVTDEGGPPTQVAVDEQDADVGLSGIFGGESSDAARPPADMPAASIDRPRMDRDEPSGYDDETDLDHGSAADSERPRRALRVVAVLGVLLLLGAGIYFGLDLFGSDPDGGDQPGSDSTAVEQTPTPEPTTQQIRDNTYVLVLSRGGETCAGNANGEVADYFDETDCTALVRELYTTELDGVPVIVSVARVTMPDEASAADFKTVVDSDGTGNIDDLLEAGERLADGPAELVPAAYASDLDGVGLTIIVAGWSDPAVPGDEQALQQLATEALALEPAA